MKIVLLVGKNKLNSLGTYRINKLYNEFKGKHEILIVKVESKSRAQSPINKKKDIFNRLINIIWGLLKKKLNANIFSYINNPVLDKNIPMILIKCNNINDEKIKNKLKELTPEILIHISSEILKETIFSIPKIGTLNLHHGILPDIRGLDSMYWGIYYNKPEWVGCTVHYIDSKIDNGDIILKRNLNYFTSNKLYKTISELEILGTQLLCEAIELLATKKNRYLSENNFIEESIYKSRINFWIYIVVSMKIKFNRWCRLKS